MDHRIGVACLVIALVASYAAAQEQTVGLIRNDEGALEGYTLFNRKSYGDAYLIDNNGDVVHSWELHSREHHSCCLHTENSNLRSSSSKFSDTCHFHCCDHHSLRCPDTLSHLPTHCHFSVSFNKLLIVLLDMLVLLRNHPMTLNCCIFQ